MVGSKYTDKNESMEQAMKQLFESDVLKKKVEDATLDMDLSDFYIYVNPTKNVAFSVQLGGMPDKGDALCVFRCHLLVLAARWKLFREEFIVSYACKAMPLEKLTQYIAANVVKLKKAGGITVSGIGLNDFLNVLSFIYSQTFVTEIPKAPAKNTPELAIWQANIVSFFTAASNMQVTEVMESIAYGFVRQGDKKFVQQLKLLSPLAQDCFNRMEEAKKFKLKAIGKAMHHVLTYSTVEKAQSLELPMTVDPTAKDAEEETLEKQEAELKLKEQLQKNKHEQKIHIAAKPKASSNMAYPAQKSAPRPTHKDKKLMDKQKKALEKAQVYTCCIVNHKNRPKKSNR